MHIHRLSQHPNVQATIEARQIEGLFCLHAPLHYRAVAASTPVRRAPRPYPGYAEIVVSMETIRQLAQEKGDSEDLLTLEGPDYEEHDPSDPTVIAWFKGIKAPAMTIRRVEIRRTELRRFWIGQFMPTLTSKLERQEPGPDEEHAFVLLLNQFEALVGKDWRQATNPTDG